MSSVEYVGEAEVPSARGTPNHGGRGRLLVTSSIDKEKGHFAVVSMISKVAREITSKDRRKFRESASEAIDGEEVSIDREELAEHVDGMYDGHSEALGRAKDHIVNTFEKVSERVTDEGPEIDDGPVEEVAEAIVSGVEAVSEHLANSEVAEKAGQAIEFVAGALHDTCREVTKGGAEAAHGVTRGLNAATGVQSKGMPAVKDGEAVVEGHLDTIKTGAEKVVTSTVEGAGNLGKVVPLGAVGESLETAAEQVGETVMKTLGETVLEETVEEIAETTLELLPVVGAVFPVYSLIDGGLKAGVGACGLVAGATVALTGGLVGAAAAPFDGGASWGGAMNLSKKTSGWSASVASEGSLIAVKGAAGLVNQVPGSQVATIPLKIGCKMGAKALNQQRNSSRGVDPVAPDDYEGAITKEMVEEKKMYQLFSPDGTRLLRATNTKSSRGYQYWLGHRGYSLTFEDTRKVETEEDASSFSLSVLEGYQDTYSLHSGMHNNNTLFFMGKTHPGEWVVWGVEGKMIGGTWEALTLQWQEDGKKFKIWGHGGQYVEWHKLEGVFKASRNECEATEFVLKEKSSS